MKIQNIILLPVYPRRKSFCACAAIKLTGCELWLAKRQDAIANATPCYIPLKRHHLVIPEHRPWPLSYIFGGLIGSMLGQLARKTFWCLQCQIAFHFSVKLVSPFLSFVNCAHASVFMFVCLCMCLCACSCVCMFGCVFNLFVFVFPFFFYKFLMTRPTLPFLYLYLSFSPLPPSI